MLCPVVPHYMFKGEICPHSTDTSEGQLCVRERGPQNVFLISRGPHYDRTFHHAVTPLLNYPVIQVIQFKKNETLEVKIYFYYTNITIFFKFQMHLSMPLLINAHNTKHTSHIIFHCNGVSKSFTNQVNTSAKGNSSHSCRVCQLCPLIA